jgi:hypothetical protein
VNLEAHTPDRHAKRSVAMVDDSVQVSGGHTSTQTNATMATRGQEMDAVRSAKLSLAGFAVVVVPIDLTPVKRSVETAGALKVKI